MQGLANLCLGRMTAAEILSDVLGIVGRAFQIWRIAEGVVIPKPILLDREILREPRPMMLAAFVRAAHAMLMRAACPGKARAVGEACRLGAAGMGKTRMRRVAGANSSAMRPAASTGAAGMGKSRMGRGAGANSSARRPATATAVPAPTATTVPAATATTGVAATATAATAATGMATTTAPAATTSMATTAATTAPAATTSTTSTTSTIMGKGSGRTGQHQQRNGDCEISSHGGDLIGSGGDYLTPLLGSLTTVRDPSPQTS
jgi:hypothetical protein